MTSKPPLDTVPPCGCVRGEDGYWAVLCDAAERLWDESRKAKTEQNPEAFIQLNADYFNHMRTAQKHQGKGMWR